jgi:hypothetical protein
MRSQQKSIPILLVTVAVLIAAAGLLLTFAQNPTAKNQKTRIDESRFPVVDESTPEPSDPIKRAKRQAKGKRFKGELRLTSNPNFQTGATVYHWPPDFPPLPVAESDLIVIGEVGDATAHISTDRTAVYSEFTVNVNRVLHNVIGASIDPKTSIVATRYGGRVKFPDGSTQLLYNTDQGMLQPGARYVLFLKRVDDDFDLLTGYELSNGKVTPLDSGTPKFSDYAGAEESYLIGEIEKLALARPKAN